MSIATAIQSLRGRVQDAYDSCEVMGATIPVSKTTANLPACIESIPQSGGGSSSPSYEEVSKEVEFCQTMFEDLGGKDTFNGAYFALRFAGLDYEKFTLSQSGIQAVQTSDGAFYTYEDGTTINHHWDSAEDFEIPEVTYNTRFNWVIYYVNATSIDINNTTLLDTAKNINVVYVFDCDVRSLNSYGGLRTDNYVLQSFDFINSHKVYTTNSNGFTSFMQGNSSLVKLPNAIDLTNATTLRQFCYNCYYLQKLPNLDTSNITDFAYFCRECNNLIELPRLNTSKGTDFNYFIAQARGISELKQIDTSNATNLSYFCFGTLGLMKMPTIDVSKATALNYFMVDCFNLRELTITGSTNVCNNFQNFCQGCRSLRTITGVVDIANSPSTNNRNVFATTYSLLNFQIKIKAGSDYNFSSSTCISIASLRYLADNAQTTSSNTMTLGSANIERINAIDPTIITTLTNKGWTVN